MAVPFSAKTSREELKTVLQGSSAGSDENAAASEGPKNTVIRRPNGQFATGTSGFQGQISTSTKGIVALIKTETNDYADLIGFLLKVAKGEEISMGTGRKNHQPSFKDRVDATNSLLDRSIGKPTQQVLHSGDDVAKELLAIRQEQLAIQKAELTRKTDERVLDVESKPITPLRVMSEGQSEG